MKVSMKTGTLALAVASALMATGCATTEPDTAYYGSPVTLRSSTPTTREVIVERVPAREVVVERAPSREVVVERAPGREVVVERVPSERVVERYVERVPAENGPGGQARLQDGTVVTYDREINLRNSPRTITVRRDEVVRFVAADGSSFIWRFNTQQDNTSFPLSTIAPTNVPTPSGTMVHVVGPSRVGRSY